MITLKFAFKIYWPLERILLISSQNRTSGTCTHRDHTYVIQVGGTPVCKENAWTFQIRVLWKTLFFCSDSSHLPGSPISTILLFGQVSLKVLAKLDSLPPRFSSKNMSPINKMSKLSAKNFDTLRKIHKVKLHIHTGCVICIWTIFESGCGIQVSQATPTKFSMLFKHNYGKLSWKFGDHSLNFSFVHGPSWLRTLESIHKYMA